MNYKEKYNEWKKYEKLEEYLKQELMEMENDDEKIKECFFNDLKFGTAGLRGIIGAGTDRMNIYTVQRATQGLANYICEKGEAEKGVAIAYDSRNFSEEFALGAASTLAGNKIKVFLFDSLRPTPELSFAVRHLGCCAGIVITASHNPKEYNGYKVYGSDGGQVANDAADIITCHIEKTDYFSGVKHMSREQAMVRGLLKYIGEDVDEAYLKCVLAERINPEIIKKQSKLKIVYTPFHGAGNKLVRESLKRAGFENVFVVPEQEKPNGDFPTVKSPNPENPEGFNLAVKLANDIEADLIVGTDPDSDRVGVLARNANGDFVPFTGNQIGALMLEYILSCKKESNTLPQNATVIKTIVTTGLANTICKHYNVEMEEVLTGFKYIADKIKEYEETGEKTYVMGFEESYGYLIGTYARDKDAVSAVLLIAEMAAMYESLGMTLCDALEAVYKKYGYYKEGNLNLYFEGLYGTQKMNDIMDGLRRNLPREIGGLRVKKTYDIKTGKCFDLENNKEYDVQLPSSNVLKFEMEKDAWMAFRPSGTEPKLKAYVGVTGKSEEECIATLQNIMDYANMVAAGEENENR